ncbi:MAG: VacJ family lipoprotein [Burkholderiales bacterium]|nr:VacJ family lipoprotein [Burkholderiales bacterium]
MRIYLLSLGLALLGLGGCATPANHYDPLEPVNRKVYGFNSAIDKAVVKPIAQGYVAVTPQPVQTGVSNFFGNLEDVYIGVSNVLSGKMHDAGGDAGRVVINTTIGIGGLFDVATKSGLPKHNNDFGQVLGRWGVGSGPYIVMPFLGPKTLRDSADWVGSYYVDPVRAIHDSDVRLGLNALRFVDLRAKLLSQEAVLQQAAFGDEYSFVRDGYLQRRYSLIWDGNPPTPLKLGDDNDFELDPPAASPQPAEGGKPADGAKPATDVPAASGAMQ